MNLSLKPNFTVPGSEGCVLLVLCLDVISGSPELQGGPDQGNHFFSFMPTDLPVAWELLTKYVQKRELKCFCCCFSFFFSFLTVIFSAHQKN